MQRRRSLVMIGLILFGALSLCAVGCGSAQSGASTHATSTTVSLANSSWPSHWHDAQHTNRSSAVGPSVPVNKGSLPFNPVVGPDGVLYGDDGGPRAIDPSDGSTKWQLRKSLPVAGAPAVLSNGTIVFTAVDKGLQSRAYVFAVDDSGHQLWRTWLGDGMSLDVAGDGVGVSDPTVGQDGTIYVSASTGLFHPDAKGAVYALNPRDGSIRWSFGPATSGFRTPVLAPDGTIYAPDDWEHVLYAINPDGSKRWRIPARCEASDPAVGTDGTLYLLVFADSGTPTRMKLLAINPDGSEKWGVPTDAQGSVAIGPTGNLYVVGGALHAVSSAGRELWSVPVENFTSAIVDGAGTMYACDGDRLLALNPDGSQKWQFKVGESSDLAVGKDGSIFVGGVVVGSAAK